MATFESVESLCQEFGLDPSKSKEELSAELTRRRTHTHADKTGGSFASPEAEANWHRITEALEYLGNNSTVSLAISSSDEIKALVASVNSLRDTLEQSGTRSGASEEDRTALIRSEISRSHRFLEIGSGTFGALCAGLLSFSGKLGSNQVLSPILLSPYGRASLFALMVLSAFAFVVTWTNERRLRGLMTFLLSDDGVATSTFWCINGGGREEPKTEITKRELVRNILSIGNTWTANPLRRLTKRLFGLRVTSGFADHIADLQLSKLLQRGAVTRSGIRGVEPLYTMDQTRALEILEDRYAIYHPSLW